MFLSILVSIALAQATPAVTPDPPVYLTGAHVLSADGTHWLEDHVVKVSYGFISEIAPSSEIEMRVGARAIDLDGLYLVPGLIDLHTHLLLHPYNETSWNDQVLKESLEERTLRGVRAARQTLEAGFTTIRDLGTEGAGWADVALRDAVERREIPGPRIFASTRALVASGCYGPSGFDPRWEVPRGAEVADGVTGVRVAVRNQISAGADWIKVYADYRRQPGGKSTPTYSLEELKAVVDEATTAGLPVAAHASTDEAIRRAIEAGVKTIEHGTNVSAETLALMKERGVALCPTLAAGEAISRYRGWNGWSDDPPRVVAQKEMMSRVIASGVHVALGSDAGVFEHGFNGREAELMGAYGMSPVAVLRAATRGAADVLGREDLGRIAVGGIGDLAAFQADPLKDSAALTRVAVVIQNGKVVHDARISSQAQVKADLVQVARKMLEDYSAGNFAELEKVFAPNACVAFDIQSSDSQVTMTAEQLLEQAKATHDPEKRFDEWLSGKATVHVDGKIAVVWVPFLIDSDDGRSTGTDVFNFIQLDGEWKVSLLSFTNRSL